MVYAKYFIRNGKKIGPYYYKTIKINGKTKTVYIGKKNPDESFLKNDNCIKRLQKRIYGALRSSLERKKVDKDEGHDGGYKRKHLFEGKRLHYAIVLLMLAALTIPFWFFDEGFRITGFDISTTDLQSDLDEKAVSGNDAKYAIQASSSAPFFYNESLDALSTTSTSYVEAFALDFTTTVQDDYLVIASGEMSYTATANQGSVNLSIDERETGEVIFRPGDTRDWLPFSFMKNTTLNSGYHSINMSFKSSAAAQTTSIRNLHILAWAVDLEAYEESDEESTASNSDGYALINKTNLTFTPTSEGDYLVFATAQYKGPELGTATRLLHTEDGAAESIGNTSLASDAGPVSYYPFGMIKNLTLDTSQHTFNIELEDIGGPTNANIRNARIGILNLSQFTVFYNESKEESSTTSTTLVEKLANEYTPSGTGEYLIMGVVNVKHSTATSSSLVEVFSDSNLIGNASFEPRSATLDYPSFFSMRVLNLSQTGHVDNISFASTAATTSVTDARLISIWLIINPPTVPDLHAPLNNTNTTIIPELNWSNSTDPEGEAIFYVLQVDNDNDFSSVEWYNGSIAETDNTTEEVSITGLINGTYYWRVAATDTFSNSSFSEAMVFTLDTEPPNVSLGPPVDFENTSDLNVTFNFTVNDALIDVDSCELWGNFTGDFIFNQSTTSMIEDETANFSEINLTEGNYIWNVQCNDTLGNAAFNDTNFTITVDTSAPNISLGPPVDFENLSYSNVTFNFTVSDTFTDIDSCELWGNFTGEFVLNQTATGITEDETTNFSEINLTDGRYIWNVQCNDTVGNTVFNDTNFTVKVDATAPVIENITYSPNESADLDPNTFVNITANISDDLTEIDTVLLRYKEQGDTSYTDVVMAYMYDNIYESNFTAGAAGGIYFFNITANNTLGNELTSDETNLTAVYDYTWERTPGSFGSVTGDLTQTKSIGVITINNTGDATLTISLTDDWINPVTYNTTSSFSIASGDIKSVDLTTQFASSDSRTDVTVTLTPSVAGQTPDPISNTVNVTMVSTSGGPILDIAWIGDTPGAAEQSATINPRASINNIGNETAANATVTWTFNSSYWEVRTGSLTDNLENLSAGDSNESNITVRVTTSVEPSTYVVFANATCDHGNGSACTGITLESINFSITVSCSDTDGVCGTGCTSTTDADCEAVTVTPSAAGVIGAGAGRSIGRIGTEKVKTVDVVELIRGKDTSFMLPIYNPYDAVMKDITIKVEGLLDQYIQVTDIPTILPRNSTEYAKVLITAPKYFTAGDFILTFTIQSKVTSKTTEGNIITRYFSEKRTVTIAVHEISREEASKFLNLGLEEIEKIEELNLTAKKLRQIFADNKEKLEKGKYEEVQKGSELIKDTAEKALKAYNKILELNEKIMLAKQRGIAVPDTIRLIDLTIAAMGREDYSTALERARDAEFTFNLETKGEFSLLYYIKNNPLTALGLTLLAASLIGASVWAYWFTKVNSELKRLAREKAILNGLIRTAQREVFEKGTISMEEYSVALKQYESRLNTIAQREMELQSIRAVLLKPVLKKYELEKRRLLDLIKQTQDEYIIQGKQETRAYRNRLQSYYTRLSEVEGKVVLKDAQTAIRKERLNRLIKRFKLKEMYAMLTSLAKEEKKLKTVSNKLFSIFHPVKKRAASELQTKKREEKKGMKR